MNGPRILPILLAVAALLVAGCAADDDDDNGATPTPGTTTPTPTPTPGATPTPDATPTPSPTPDPVTPVAPELTLTATRVPTSAIVGEPFTFNLTVEGGEGFTSDHIGAHFGPDATDAPSVAALPRACQHQEGELPGEFVVTCTPEETGTIHLFGHTRLNLSGQLHNYWTEQHVVVVREPVGEFTLAATDVPLTVSPGSTFNFTLTVDGEPADFSDHIGAHWGPNATADEDASVRAYPLACQHQEGELPGTFTVTCPVEDTLAPGTYYLRGHVRITAAGPQHNFWSAEHTILVA